MTVTRLMPQVMPRRIVVIGASGVLGGKVCQALTALNPGAELVRGMRRPDGPDAVHVDVTDEASIARACAGADVVVNVVAQSRPLVQEVCARLGIPSVDAVGGLGCGAVLDMARRQLPQSAAPAVMLTGLFPGISALLSAHVVEGLSARVPGLEVTDIAVSLLQNTRPAAAGSMGMVDMLTAIATPVETQAGLRPAFSGKRSMMFGARSYPVRRLQYDERDVLRQRYPTAEVGYYTGWNNFAQTAGVAALVRMGLLPGILSKKSVMKLVDKAVLSPSPRKPTQPSPDQTHTAYVTTEVAFTGDWATGPGTAARTSEASTGSGAVIGSEASVADVAQTAGYPSRRPVVNLARATLEVADDYLATAYVTAATVSCLLDRWNPSSASGGQFPDGQLPGGQSDHGQCPAGTAPPAATSSALSGVLTPVDFMTVDDALGLIPQEAGIRLLA